MMVGMGLSKTDRAFYLVKNKNTDELYSERIKFDNYEFEGLMYLAMEVINSEEALDRCASREDDFRCKFCDAYDICWGEDKIVTKVLETFNGKMIGCEELNLIEKYPPDCSELVWSGSEDITENIEKIIGDLECTGNFENADYESWEYGGKYLVVSSNSDTYFWVRGGKE